MNTLALLLAAQLAAGPPADPAPEDADAHARRGGELFEAGRFSDSARAFESAYEVSENPVYLFAWAQALRRAGNCEVAMDLLERYLETEPPRSDVAVAQDVLDACREVLGLPAPEPLPPEVNVPPPVVVTPDVTPASRPWHRDPLGGVLLGTGALSAGAAVVLYGLARTRASDRDGTETAYLDRRAGAQAMARVSIGLAAGAAALLTGSIIRYALVRRNASGS